MIMRNNKYNCELIEIKVKQEDGCVLTEIKVTPNKSNSSKGGGGR